MPDRTGSMPSTTLPSNKLGAVVAIKPLDRAKSRIAADAAVRRELAWAMLIDTTAVLAAVLDKVLVVGDGLEPGLVDQLLGQQGHHPWPADQACAEQRRKPVVDLYADPGPDLNAAFIAGAQRLIEQGFVDVLACVADLPALRASSVAEFTSSAPARSRLFLADAQGLGTTMLLGRSLPSGAALDPRFEGGSATQHRTSGAIDPAPLRWPDARHDVDTLADLAVADDLGLGPATRELGEIRASPADHRL